MRPTGGREGGRFVLRGVDVGMRWSSPDGWETSTRRRADAAGNLEGGASSPPGGLGRGHRDERGADDAGPSTMFVFDYGAGALRTQSLRQGSPSSALPPATFSAGPTTPLPPAGRGDTVA